MPRLKNQDVAKHLSSEKNILAVQELMNIDSLNFFVDSAPDAIQFLKGEQQKTQDMLELRPTTIPEVKAQLAAAGYGFDESALIDRINPKRTYKKRKTTSVRKDANKTPGVVVQPSGDFRPWPRKGTAPSQFKEAAKRLKIDPFSDVFSIDGDIYVHNKPFSDQKKLMDREDWSKHFPNIPHPLESKKPAKRKAKPKATK